MKRMSRKRRRDLRARSELRAAIMRRDRGRCRHCGEYAVDVHHVVKRSQSTALATAPDNLIALCRFCHDWTDAAGSSASGRLVIHSLGAGRFRFQVQTVDKFAARAKQVGA